MKKLRELPAELCDRLELPGELLPGAGSLTVSGGRREELNIIEGTVPLLSQIPRGCRFRPRCPYAAPACAETMPELNVLPSGQKVRCFRAKELSEAR